MSSVCKELNVHIKKSFVSSIRMQTSFKVYLWKFFFPSAGEGEVSGLVKMDKDDVIKYSKFTPSFLCLVDTQFKRKIT